MNKDKRLSRRDVVKQILSLRTDELVISSLGNPTYDVAAAGDHSNNFYLWGAMGGATMLAYGVAIAQPNRRVIVFAGDGEMMMGLGSLVTIACDNPKNLTIVVLDNEKYAETGMQKGHSGRGADLTIIAKGAGIKNARTVKTESDLSSFINEHKNSKELEFVNIKVSSSTPSLVVPPRDGAYLRGRFMESLGTQSGLL